METHLEGSSEHYTRLRSKAGPRALPPLRESEGAPYSPKAKPLSDSRGAKTVTIFRKEGREEGSKTGSDEEDQGGRHTSKGRQALYARPWVHPKFRQKE